MPLNIVIKTDSTYRCDTCGKIDKSNIDETITSGSDLRFTNGLWMLLPVGWSIYSSINKVYCDEHFYDGLQDRIKRGGSTT